MVSALAEYGHIHDIVPWAEVQALPYSVSLDEQTYKLAATGLRAVKTHIESEYVPWSLVRTLGIQRHITRND